MDKTTPEIILDFEKDHLFSYALQKDITAFLNRVDLVKFSDYLPPLENIKKDKQQLIDFVKLTYQELSSAIPPSNL